MTARAPFSSPLAGPSLAVALAGVCGLARAHAQVPARAPVEPRRVEHRDDFARPLPRSEYALSAAPGCAVRVVDAALRMTVARPSAFVAGQLVLDAALAPSASHPLVASVRIRLRQSSSDLGSTARLQLVDGASWVNFGAVAASGAAYQVQRRGPGSVAQTVVSSSPRDDRWHAYRIEYDGSVARLSLDGALVASVPVELQSPRVWLQVHSHHAQPGTALGEFDDLEVSGAGL